ncbi:MAG: AAA domain-containing protein [Gammaproteobacteria bacterium]|nr:AAA domain-containing protein [Gammaproteobacteria bacterium]
MNEVEKGILRAVANNPGLQIKDIKQMLDIGIDDVEQALSGQIKSKLRQDKACRWYLKETSSTENLEESSEQPDPSLTRLCRYYLDCLSQDTPSSVSEFATSKYGQKYVELDVLPMLEQEKSNPFETESGQRFLMRVRRDRNPKVVQLGYPVRLNFVRSSRWEGFKVEPILLFRFQDTNHAGGGMMLAGDLPQINFQALQALPNAGKSNLMEEASQIMDGIGLGDAAINPPDIDELLMRLRTMRPEWDWLENINPRTLSKGAPLSQLRQQGIFNRAILTASEAPPYTKGLESELGVLTSIPKGKCQGTVLGSWIDGQSDEPSTTTRKSSLSAVLMLISCGIQWLFRPAKKQLPLLEVLPLNSEQRQAVQQALSNSVTVITGPPGTGKSQVVTSILMNAAWQNMTILFASKNNKAVDVVETRVNALGSRPVLLRLGANQYQSRFAQHLVSLLSMTSTPDNQARYREHETIHANLGQSSKLIDAKIEALIALRNKIDHLEQQIELFRQEVGDDIFQQCKIVEGQKLEQESQSLISVINQADKERQTLLTRLIWLLIRNFRFKRLNKACKAFKEISSQIGLPMPEMAAEAATADQWLEYRTQIKARVAQSLKAIEYFERLESLAELSSLEELNEQRRALTRDISTNSERLWKAWLRLQPSRINEQQRKLLGDYSALLQMIVAANDEGKQPSKEIYRRFYNLFPQIAPILSCWAVTSLSAKGRIPLEPGFFDLLIIDEASQCDIASALPLLYRAHRVVIIGDPMQLRHISALPKQQDQQFLSKYDLINDYPGWAYSTRSLFDVASSLCRSEDIVALQDHHRSHADIIGFSNEVFYDGRLRVATNYDRLLRPREDEPAIRWIDIAGKTVRPAAGGAVNEIEAKAVVGEISRLVAEGYQGSIGVVSPFRIQANRIRDLVRFDDELSKRLDKSFLSDTVHKFQGDERDIIIFSPVISSGASKGAIGFLKSTPNLFNVAVTRARAALVIVGDRKMALNHGVDYLSKFSSYVDSVSDKYQLSGNQDSMDCGPEYPSVARPELVSDWERLFYNKFYAAGIRLIPQYQVEKYVLDFAIIVDDNKRLNIEIDGEMYHRNWDGERCRRDQIRNQRLIELGWDVMRFWVYQVRDDFERCFLRVQRWIDNKTDSDRNQAA